MTLSHVCMMWHRFSTFHCAGKLQMDAGQPKRQQAPARAAPRQPASALGYRTDMCGCFASLLGDDNRVHMFFLFFVGCASNQPTNHPSIHPSIVHVPVYLLHLFVFLSFLHYFISSFCSVFLSAFLSTYFLLFLSTDMIRYGNQKQKQ